MQSAPEPLTTSMENYLEAIFHIVAAKQAARAKDIADRRGVTNSSVTQALGVLADRGLVNYAPYDVITLTPDGRAAAEDVVRRHEALASFFVRVLAIDPAVAEDGACKMEHALPRDILDRLVQFIEFVEGGAGGSDQWVRRFSRFLDRADGKRPEAGRRT